MGVPLSDPSAKMRAPDRRRSPMSVFLQYLDDMAKELVIQLTRIADALDRIATEQEAKS